MPIKRRRMPRDPNALAHAIGRLATGEESPADPADAAKDPAAVKRGRAGGLKGGKARTKAMTKAERSALARKAARARWPKP